MKQEKIVYWNSLDGNQLERIASTSGLEYLKAIKDNTVNPPPAASLIGMRIAFVDKGHTIFELDPQEYHYNSVATVHGGILSTLLDSAMTSAILSMLDKGFGCTTVEFKVNFVKPVTKETGILLCEAKPIHIGKRLATVEGHLKNKDGDLHAHGVSTCSVFQVTGF